MALDFLSPLLFLKKRLKDYDYYRIDVDKYDVVYASGAFSTVAAILKLNPKADFILYDDGLGSYMGSIDEIITRSSGGRLNKMFCVFFHVGSYVCKPSKLLVNNPSFSKSISANQEKIYGLPDIDGQFIDFCNSIFCVNSSSSTSFYWLTQPVDCNVGAEKVRDEVKKILLPYASYITVRLHPRDLDFKFYNDFSIENSNDFWELSVLNKNIDSLILVSEFSSAQMTPKMLFGIEPIVVFLYRLNNSYSEEKLAIMNQNVIKLRSLYEHPEKVLIPSDLEEFKRNLSALIQHQKRKQESTLW